MKKKLTGFENILVIRLDSLGDTLLSTPVVKTLKERFPQSHLIYLVSPQAEQIVENNPYIDELIIFDYYKSSLKEKLKLGNLLAGKKIKLVVNLSEKFWTYWWANKTRACRKIGFYPAWSQPVKSLLVFKWLTDRVNLTKRFQLHEVERYFELLKSIDIVEPPNSLEMFFDKQEEDFIKALIKDWEIKEESNLFGLHLSEKWFYEGWSKEHLYKIIHILLDKYSKDILVLSCGPQEKDWADSFLSKIKSKRLKVFYNEDLKIFAALVKREKILITPDTLAVHIASVVKTPVVDIFGDRFFSHISSRWAPWKTIHKIIKKPSIRGSSKTESSKKETFFVKELLKSVNELKL